MVTLVPVVLLAKLPVMKIQQLLVRHSGTLLVAKEMMPIEEVVLQVPLLWGVGIATRFRSHGHQGGLGRGCLR